VDNPVFALGVAFKPKVTWSEKQRRSASALREFRSKQLLDAMLHLARRLVGEGDGEDFARPGAAGGEDVGDARGELARLASAGAGEHQNRPIQALDRKPLFGIEAGEIARARRRRLR
jgi:hypothetical protein